MKLENEFIALTISDERGSWKFLDKRAEVTWESRPDRFGEISIKTQEGVKTIPLIPDHINREGRSLRLSFHDDRFGRLALNVTMELVGNSLEISYDGTGEIGIESLTLLDEGLRMSDRDSAYLLVPVRLGLMIPSDSGLEFTRRFGTFDYEGCHMEMLGAVKNGGAILVTWHDPYVIAEVKSVLEEEGQLLSASFIMRKTARSIRIYALGVGDFNLIAQEYRKIAREKGWLVTWGEKLKEHPQAKKLFGAVNFKLWTALARRIGEDLKEVSVEVKWTFDEVARIAEHLKEDLKLERVLFILGGWIRKGYDCQHPDILPAAPECGGNEGLRDCARRVQRCGYLFALHDNYQDMYRDAPSWDEDYIMKHPDGSLHKGGLWLGGRAFLTCSKKAVELAKRPQNLPKVKELFNPDVYFIDTTYAAGLYECFDPNHPLTKWDDMYWKQVISDYARDLFGLFGSECGREWAIPHADWFEGLTGVSGRYYHNLDPKSFGGTVVPIFEMVYRDGIVMHGKYGYKFEEAAEYVLHHVSIGRTLNYHSIGPHLYWENDRTDELPFPPEGEPDRACFTRAHNGWAEGMCLTDRFIKNTYEILSPLNELTSRIRLTHLRFLSKDRRVRETRFGEEMRVVVNGGEGNYIVTSELGGVVVLPPFGFTVESPLFVAFHALSWGSVEYERPVLFTLRSLDGKPLYRSDKVRIYHGFGDVRLGWRNDIIEVKGEIVR
ncbi:hypothetical protein J7M22_07850 [Candidatus Poribacteria bacterium]|nr:hypothetical protein [Candidatus Poribacteria bacterium]